MDTKHILPNGLLILICFVFGAFLPVGVSARENLNMSLVSNNFAQWRSVIDICIEGDYAYVSTRDSGLFILDISDVSNPEAVASFERDEPIEKSLVRDGLLYVLGWNSLSILDVNQPSDPILLGTYDHPWNNITNLALAGDYAYMSGSVFLVVNISDSAHPFLETSLSPGTLYIMDWKLKNGYLYTADYYAGLQIYDLTNPALPVLTGAFQTHFPPSCITVEGSYAYLGTDITGGSNGMFIIDVSQAAMPVPVGYMLCARAGDIAFRNNLVYLRSSSSIKVIDVSVPEQPSELYSHQHPYYICASEFSSNRLFVGENLSSGIRMSILDFSPASEFTHLGHYGPMPEIMHLTSSGSIVFISTEDERLLAVDCTIPAHPQVLGTIALAASEGPSLVRGSQLYIVDSQNVMSILDISDPANLVVLGSYPCGSRVLSLAQKEDVLYVGLHYAQQIKILDVSNPSAVTQIGSIPEGFYNMTLEGDYLYLTSYGIAVYDVSSPALPVRLGSFAHGPYYSGGLEKEGNYLYAATSRIMDVFTCNNPTTPQYATSITLTYGLSGIVAQQNRIFVNNSNIDVHVLERNGAGNMQIIGYYEVRGGARDMAVSGNDVYVANANSFRILHYDGDSSSGHTPPPVDMTNTIQNHPNPFNPGTTIDFMLPRSGAVDIAVFNVRGQRLRTLARREFLSGDHSLFWDGKDDNGNPQSSGVYFVRLESGSDIRVGKMLMLK